ncbi:MAG: single-stranded DNA-binding protein [Myxococcales bacterium]|nr:single-stranded DNA-binding protein [Myxococcales bacterium]
MANVNKVILIGRLGNQPELRYTPANRAVTELRMAVNHVWTDRSGQRQEKTDWFSVDVWDKQAETAERYLQKGREVYIEGRLTNDDWVDKDGQKRSRTKIVCERMQFIGDRRDGERGPGEGRPARPAAAGGGGSFAGSNTPGGSDAPGGGAGPAPGMGHDGPTDYGPPPDDDIPF